MDSSLNLPWEYTTLINELTQGMEKAKLLHFHLCSSSLDEEQELLLQRILSSYEKALSILKWNGSPAGQTQVPTLISGGPESSVSGLSADGSPRSSDNLNKNSRGHQELAATKKRKIQPKWTEQVRINSETGLDGPSDDGFSWRKYGQKDILGAKYPRSYYRCTYRHAQNCWASKQVQRSDSDPNVFEVTYKGAHTCSNQSAHQTQEQHSKQTLLSFKANLRVTTDNSENNKNDNIIINNKYETSQPQFSFPTMYEEIYDLPLASLMGEEDHLGSQSSLFLSPATSGTSYFSPVETYQVQGFGGGGYNYQNREYNINEIISAQASTTSSPIGGMEFQADQFGLAPNFTSNCSGYLM
ncbi:Probable WRKY transcription factor 41 [Striga hermonthica]|uniref:Probable WRKY transcription factor 41 n=1 Tax=Striga hermonthica TaxID=68872 RepID=A0A9N7NXC4_STRHE|nr:Probable WRKY transcription factor 41 [Striga hermonthica]